MRFSSWCAAGKERVALRVLGVAVVWALLTTPCLVLIVREWGVLWEAHGRGEYGSLFFDHHSLQNQSTLLAILKFSVFWVLWVSLTLVISLWPTWLLLRRFLKELDEFLFKLEKPTQGEEREKLVDA